MDSGRRPEPLVGFSGFAKAPSAAAAVVWTVALSVSRRVSDPALIAFLAYIILCLSLRCMSCGPLFSCSLIFSCSLHAPKPSQRSSVVGVCIDLLLLPLIQLCALLLRRAALVSSRQPAGAAMSGLDGLLRGYSRISPPSRHFLGLMAHTKYV